MKQKTRNNLIQLGNVCMSASYFTHAEMTPDCPASFQSFFFWRPPRPSASLDLPLDHLSVLLCDTLITLPLSQGPNSAWHRASDTFTSELKRGSAAFVPQTCL